MNRNHESIQPIDFDAYRARAEELRQREFDRLFDRLFARLFAFRRPQPRASHAAPFGTQPSRC